jgi:putative transposase
VIYTTNGVESVHAQLRKIIKTRGHFPNDDAATKLIWLALRNITAKWERAAPSWRLAMNQFAILYGEEFRKRSHVLEPVRDHPLGNLRAAFFSVCGDRRCHIHCRLREALCGGNRRFPFELLDSLAFQTLRFAPIGRPERLALPMAVHHRIEPVLITALPQTHRLAPCSNC